MTDAAKYLWVDLETTGLDPARCAILEIAAVVTGADLVPIWSWERVFWFAYHDLWHDRELVARGHREPITPEVLAMHTENGLWNECAAAKLGCGIDPLLEMVDRTTWSDGRPILAGSSVHFNRSFLAVDFEEIIPRLHYRMHDVRALVNAAVDAGHAPPAVVGDVQHRAMPDVLHALDRARWVRGLLRGAQ